MTEGPARTCVGCRRVGAKRARIRLVRQENGIVVADGAGTAAGRGAYVCGDARCIERGLNRSRLTHAFKKPSEARSDLAEEVRGLWQRRK